MYKLKLFLENFLVYGLSGIFSGLIPLLMLPVITRLMPDSAYYGLSDMCNTIISFVSAFAILGMYDALYRLFFEKEEKKYRKDLCSTVLVFNILASLIVCVFLIALKNFFAEKFLGGRQHVYLIYIVAVTTLFQSVNVIVSAPTRMQNKRRVYLTMSIVNPVFLYGTALLMLLCGWHIIALPVATCAAASMNLLVFGILNRKWFDLRIFKTKYLKPLLYMAVPLLPNFLIYWIFNSCDKVMITNMLGMDATGVYSVSSKLGHASQLIYTAFAGGWQYFAFSTMKEGDQVKTNSMVFEYLGVISFAAGILVCAGSHWLFQLLFTGNYVRGYIAAPYLFLAPLLQMLYQIAGNQFLIIKKTWPSMLILSSGALANIILNLWLIPILGIEGAAIATLSGYIISDIICVFVLKRMKLIEITGRFKMALCCTALYFVFWRLCLPENTVFAFLLALGVMVCFFYLYRKDIVTLLKMMLMRNSNVV